MLKETPKKLNKPVGGGPIDYGGVSECISGGKWNWVGPIRSDILN